MGEFEWELAVVRARRIRDKLGFSQRVVFDNELRPFVDNGRIAYPDAIYHITQEDVDRALITASERKL